MKFTVKLNSNKDFTSLYKKGRFVAGANCVIYFRKNGKNFNRVGISTSKKIGNAVKRSRARRVIRQAYRETEALFPVGYDLVFTARQPSTECKTYHITGFIRKKALPFIMKNTANNGKNTADNGKNNKK